MASLALPWLVLSEIHSQKVATLKGAGHTELQWLTAHLAERLTGLHDGQPKVFRDSAVENLREFFERFRRLNNRSSPELDGLVQQAQQTINGVEPQTLRGRAKKGCRGPWMALEPCTRHDAAQKSARRGHGRPGGRNRGRKPRKNQPAGAMDGPAGVKWRG